MNFGHADHASQQSCSVPNWWSIMSIRCVCSIAEKCLWYFHQGVIANTIPGVQIIPLYNELQKMKKISNHSTHIFLKITQNVLLIWILAFSTSSCPIEIDLSGNTVWLQASVPRKIDKLTHFQQNNFWNSSSYHPTHPTFWKYVFQQKR